MLKKCLLSKLRKSFLTVYMAHISMWMITCKTEALFSVSGVFLSTALSRQRSLFASQSLNHVSGSAQEGHVGLRAPDVTVIRAQVSHKTSGQVHSAKPN